jgi:hypothetical protein
MQGAAAILLLQGGATTYTPGKSLLIGVLATSNAFDRSADVASYSRTRIEGVRQHVS